MADKKIKSSDLFEDDVFLKTKEDAVAFLETLDVVKKGFKDLLADSKALKLNGPFANSKDIEKLNKALVENERIRTKLDQLSVEQLKAEQKLSELIEKETQEREKSNQQLKRSLAEEEKLKQQRLKTTREELKNEQALQKAIAAENKEREKKEAILRKESSAYAKLSKDLSDSKKKVKDLLASGKALTEEDRKLIVATQQLDKRLKEIDKTVGDTQRSVGNYKDAVKEALEETGVFNTGIGRIITTLKKLRAQQEETSKSSEKLGNVLKLVGVGIAIAALTAAVKVVTELKDINQKLTDGMERSIGVTKSYALAAVSFGMSAAEAAKRANQFYDVLFFSRKALRELSKEIQQVTLDEEDFNEISNDATIGFDERNRALKEAITLSKQRAELSVKSASLELDVINKEIQAREAIVGIGNATNDLLDKRTEAEKKLNEALDVQADLVRQNSERDRQRRVEQAITEIELLRSKKLSYNSQAKILEQELADNKNQLEERRKIAKELLDVNKGVTAEEIKIFKEKIGIQFNENKLLQEQDAKLLKQRLESLRTLEGKGLGEGALSELAKVIKEAQENELEYKKSIAKLDDEEIARKNKIADIQAEVAQLNGQILQQQLKTRMEAQADLQEEYNSKLLEGDNAFNGKLLRARQRSQVEIQNILQQEKTLKEQLLAAEEKQSLAKAEQEINDKKILAEEKLRIEKEYQLKRQILEDETLSAINENDTQDLEQLEALRKKRWEIVSDEAKDLISIGENALQIASDKRQEALDQEIDQRKTSLSKQERLAEQGLKNTLAFETKKLAEAELRKREEKEKEIRRQKAIAYINAFAEYAKQDPNSAPFKALASVVIAESIAGAFKDGVEKIQGPGTETSDSILALLSKNESVITAKSTTEAPGLATAWNKEGLDGAAKWMAENYPMAGTGMLNGPAMIATDGASVQELKVLNKKIESLEETIRNKKEVTVDWDKHGNMVINEVENGIKRAITYMKQRPRI